MILLVVLALLALFGVAASAWAIRTDGYRRVPTDPRRLPGGTATSAARGGAKVGEPVSASGPPRAPAAPPLPDPTSLRRRHRDAARA